MTTRCRHGLLAILGGLAVAVTLHGQTQSPRMALQAAIKLELVDGDLTGAIERYAELSQNADPTVAAEALARLAGGYIKLGRSSEARTAYERIVRDYPGQAEVVADARRWLAAQSPAPTAPASRREELVWTGPEVNFEGRTTADGRYLFFVWWEHGLGNLAVRDLSTGEQRVLIADATSKSWAENPVPSVDGRRIAYRSSEKESAIRLIDADGRNMRVLLRDDHQHYLQAWSPDGRFLVATRSNPDDTFAIVLISTDDGSTIQVRTTGPHYADVGGFSADARYVVYALGQAGPTDTGGVYLLPIDLSTGSPEVGSEIALVEGPAQFGSPLWTPDRRRVVFSSTLGGSSELWAVGVTNGRSNGSPERVQAGRAGRPGASVLGFTSDGSLYYGATERRDEAYSAAFDPTTLTAGTPVLVSDRGIGNNRNPVWSPDGESVAFLRRLPGRNAPGGAPVIVRDSRTGAERKVAALGRGAYGARALEWFPDGRSLLVTDGTNVQGERRKRFRQVDVQSGEERLVFDGPWSVWIGALAADGRELFYSIREEDTIRLVKRQIDTGEESELYRHAEPDGGTVGLQGLSASPDGAQLAFMLSTDDGGRSLVVVATDDGTPREVHRFPSWYGTSPGQGLTWTADSRHIVFTGRCAPDKPDDGEDSWQLCAIPAEGGDVRSLGLSMPDIASREISTDGRRVAFTGTTITREVWVARNLFADGR